MSNQMEIDNSHFKRMKKVVADIEKDWKLGAISGVKEQLKMLTILARDVEVVIKNQLYYNLNAPERETNNGQTNSSEGRGPDQTS